MRLPDAALAGAVSCSRMSAPAVIVVVSVRLLLPGWISPAVGMLAVSETEPADEVSTFTMPETEPLGAKRGHVAGHARGACRRRRRAAGQRAGRAGESRGGGDVEGDRGRGRGVEAVVVDPYLVFDRSARGDGIEARIGEVDDPVVALRLRNRAGGEKDQSPEGRTQSVASARSPCRGMSRRGTGNDAGQEPPQNADQGKAPKKSLSHNRELVHHLVNEWKDRRAAPASEAANMCW
jgi:hypothetical protein